MRVLSSAILVSALAIAGCAPEPAEAPTRSSSQLVLADVGADLIHRYDCTSGARLEAGFALGPVTGPAGLTPSLDGEVLYVSSFDTHAVTRFSAAEGARSRVLFADPSLLEEPVAITPHGEDLLVLGNDSGNVVRLSTDGEVLDTFGRGFLRSPHDLALGPDGLLYVANTAWRADVGLIQVFDPDVGERVREFAFPDLLLDASSVAFDHDGTLLVSDWFGSRVLRLDPLSGDLLEVVLESDDGLDQPFDLVVGDEALFLIDGPDILRADEQGLTTLVRGEDHGLDWPRTLELL